MAAARKRGDHQRDGVVLAEDDGLDVPAQAVGDGGRPLEALDSGCVGHVVDPEGTRPAEGSAFGGRVTRLVT